MPKQVFIVACVVIFLWMFTHPLHAGESDIPSHSFSPNRFSTPIEEFSPSDDSGLHIVSIESLPEEVRIQLRALVIALHPNDAHDQEALTNKINQKLLEMKADGTLDRIINKYQ